MCIKTSASAEAYKSLYGVEVTGASIIELVNNFCKIISKGND